MKDYKHIIEIQHRSHCIISIVNTWQSEIQAEFERAEQARVRGKEGQARVCARRAAGIAIREYLTRRGIHPPSVSAYDLLNLIKDDPHLSADLKRIADHLTLRVTEEFKLPVNADLVAEARKFCAELLK
jgi:HEPN domain-containing protein